MYALIRKRKEDAGSLFVFVFLFVLWCTCKYPDLGYQLNLVIIYSNICMCYIRLLAVLWSLMLQIHQAGIIFDLRGRVLHGGAHLVGTARWPLCSNPFLTHVCLVFSWVFCNSFVSLLSFFICLHWCRFCVFVLSCSVGVYIVCCISSMYSFSAIRWHVRCISVKCMLATSV